MMTADSAIGRTPENTNTTLESRKRFWPLQAASIASNPSFSRYFTVSSILTSLAMSFPLRESRVIAPDADSGNPGLKAGRDR